MDKQNGIEILAVVLLLAVLFQTVQVLGMAGRTAAAGAPTGMVAAAGTGPYDGYNTYEEMMAAHHGTAAPAQGALGSLPQQQGGC